MVFGFDTGKVTKVPVNVYETKTNRKKLIKAFYGKAPCVGISYVTNEDVLALTREDEKTAYVAVSSIEEKQKKDANGIQALTITKKIGMKRLMKVQEVTEEISSKIATDLPVSVRGL